jgi:hypothetical protein
MRNRFAHKPGAQFQEEDARELFASWTHVVRRVETRTLDAFDSPIEVFAAAIKVASAFLEAGISQLRDNRVQVQATLDAAQDSALYRERGQKPSEYVADAVARDRANRESRGDL